MVCRLFLSKNLQSTLLFALLLFCAITQTLAGGLGGNGHCDGPPEDTCGKFGKCVSVDNNNVQFTCDCDDGYEQNSAGSKCVKKKVVDGICSSVNCGGALGDCQAILGGSPQYVCKCHDGAKHRDGGVNSSPCVADSPDDPCNNVDCGPTGVCKPVFNSDSHTCACGAGYSVQGLGGKCAKDDPCAGDVCGDNATCNASSSESDGYTCVCNKGYVHKNPTDKCTIDDPCAGDVCGDNATCNASSSEPDGYTCVCNKGYVYKNPTDKCTIDDPCAGDVCGDNATCNASSSEPDRYTCSCNKGYIHKNPTDKCTKDVCEPNPCMKNEVCTADSSSSSGYSCSCKPGYVKKDGQCKDASDPCLNSPCGPRGVCVSSSSNIGYMCNCDIGYESVPEGSPCKAKDPCEGVTTCGPGKCEAFGSSYRCTCPSGFKNKDNSPRGRCVKDYCPTSVDCGVGQCKALQSSYACSCINGAQQLDPNNPESKCAINPCDKDLCNHGTCHVKKDAFMCTCNDGYVYDSSIGQCKSKVPPKKPCDGQTCGPKENGKCENDGNSFKCVCNEGFINLDGNPQKPCEKKPNPCTGVVVCGAHGHCQEQGSDYLCKCDPGYSNSKPQDECKKSLDPCQAVNCGEQGTCKVHGITFTCSCPTGYTQTSATAPCMKKEDPCNNVNCGDGHCKATSHGAFNYTCVCNTGAKSIDGKQIGPCSSSHVDKRSNSDGLSVGAIVGISIGAAAFVVILVVFVLWRVRVTRTKQKQKKMRNLEKTLGIGFINGNNSKIEESSVPVPSMSGAYDGIYETCKRTSSVYDNVSLSVYDKPSLGHTVSSAGKTHNTGGAQIMPELTSPSIGMHGIDCHYDDPHKA